MDHSGDKGEGEEGDDMPFLCFVVENLGVCVCVCVLGW